jgi:hypothetical protein
MFRKLSLAIALAYFLLCGSMQASAETETIYFSPQSATWFYDFVHKNGTPTNEQEGEVLQSSFKTHAESACINVKVEVPEKQRGVLFFKGTCNMRFTDKGRVTSSSNNITLYLDADTGELLFVDIPGITEKAPFFDEKSFIRGVSKTMNEIVREQISRTPR